MLDRKDFVETVMSKRCNWIFDDRTICKRIDAMINHLKKRKVEP